ncbi:MAG: GNAT family N-acetyltransferase [Litoreibacter sp.]|nr:GNAT family N-acetyltransferase [Litoreibacter sp.]
MKLRRFCDRDAKATYDIFFTSVRKGTAEHYSLRQREAWAGSSVQPENWCRRLGSQHTLVAEMEGRIVGFMSLKESGFLDLAFVFPNTMGTRVSDRLYEALEEWAREQKLEKLTTNASHLARSFLARYGWEVVKAQTVMSNGREIENFQMEKLLT